MIKLALLTLIIAIVAGVLGFPGVYEFSLGLSKLLFGIVGLSILLVALLALYFYRKLKAERNLYQG